MMLWMFIAFSNINFETMARFDLSTVKIYGPSFYTVNDKDLVAIIDSDNRMVLTDFQGNIKKRCGRKGQGPGEFQIITRVTWDRIQRVFVIVDEGNHRLSVWDEKGNLKKEYPLPPGASEPGFPKPGVLFIVKDKHGWTTGKPTLLNYYLETEISEPIWHYTVPKNQARTTYVLQNGDRESSFNSPWDEKILHALGRDFAAVTYSGREEIQILNLDGKPLNKFRYKMRRRELTQANVDELLRFWPEAFRRKLNRVERPELWPAVGAIRIDGNGRVWLFGFGEKSFENCDLTVYSRSGKQLGKGVVKMRPEIIHGNVLYYQITEGEDRVVLEKVAFSL